MVPQLVEISVTPPTRLRYISRKLGTWFLGVLKGTAMFVTATGHAEPSWERLLELEEMVLVSHGALS